MKKYYNEFHLTQSNNNETDQNISNFPSNTYNFYNEQNQFFFNFMKKCENSVYIIITGISLTFFTNLLIEFMSYIFIIFKDEKVMDENIDYESNNSHDNTIKKHDNLLILFKLIIYGIEIIINMIAIISSLLIIYILCKISVSDIKIDNFLFYVYFILSIFEIFYSILQIYILEL
jgi:hypothetical protein